MEVPGDDAAAGSTKRESKGGEKDRAHKRSSPRSSAAAEAAGPRDHRRKEERRGRKSTERDISEKSGPSRSRRRSSLSAAPADETKRADDASALPSSPSTARSSTVKAEGEHGQKRKNERRRRSGESRSSASSHTPTIRKSSKDGTSRRGERSSQATPSDTLVEAKAPETTAAPTARAPSSAKGSKPRKRSRSSKTASVNDDHDHDNEREETSQIQQTTAVPSGGANAGRAATPSSSRRTASKDVRPNAAIAPSYDFPKPVEASNRRECVIQDKQPVTPMAENSELPAKGPNNGVLKIESSCREAEAEGSAPEGGARSGRQKSASRRGEEAGQETSPGMSNRNGSPDDGPPRRHHSSTAEKRPRRKRAETDPSASTALGVKVIDEGETKHLVLTAGEATAGDGKSGSGSDRSRGGISSSRRGNRGRITSKPVQQVGIHSQHQERSTRLRDNVATAVRPTGGDAVNPTPSPQRGECLTDAFHQRVVRDEITARAASWQAAPTERLEVEKRQSSGPTNDHHPEHPLIFAKSMEAPAGKSPSNSHCMAPSFSIPTSGSRSNQQAREREPPPPYNKRPSLHRATPLPDMSEPGNNPRGAQSSPTSSTSSSSSSSPLRGHPVSDRTAKYVTHQASFHADISDDYVDPNSPLGTVRGETGTGGEEPDMGKATSRAKHDSAPVVSSSRKPPDMVRETSSQGERQKVSCSAAPGTTGGKAEDLLASSLTPSAAIPVGTLAGEDGNSRLDPNQQGHAGRDATPSLSQDRLVDESVEDDDGPARDLLHFRTDARRHLVCGGRPELFFLRPNESLAVTRIEGSGRLLVTVREEAGAAAVVVVDRAIVHDSAAHFGHAAVQTDHRFPYVAGHRYEFRAEPAQGVELAVRGGGDRQATPLSQGSRAENPETGLHVVFSVTSAYTKGARLCPKDAVRSSLPTFEAPQGYNPQQPKEPQSSLAATASAPSSAAAESNSSTQCAPEPKPTSGDVRRSPSPSVAEALIAPCISPPPAGTGNLGALRARTETSAPTPRVPAPAAATKALAEKSSNRMVSSGGTGEGLAKGGPPQNTASGDQVRVLERKGQPWSGSGVEIERRHDRERNTFGSGQDSRERSSPIRARAVGSSPRTFMPVSLPLYPHNAQQYRERVPEGATAMMGGDLPPADGLKWNPAWEQQRLPTLPYIRHVDHTTPRSAFEQHSPSGVAGSFSIRDSVAGADRFVHPPGYFAHEPPIQRKRQVEAGRVEDELHNGYLPAREQSLHGPPPRVYHPGYKSDLHSSVATGREHNVPPGGGGSHWGERGDGREQPRVSDNQSRWREDDHEGWARKSDRNPYFATGHAYQPASGRDHNRGHDPRRYRSDHGGRMNNASSLSDSSCHGCKNGNGLPPSGKEPAKMARAAGGALSDPSRGRALARGGAAMGTGRREERREIEPTGHIDSHVDNGGYSDGQARRGVNNITSRESERRKRTPQRTHGDDPHHPTAYRKSRHGSSSTTMERAPPRWIKF